MAEAVLPRATAGVPLERIGVVSYPRAALAAFTAVYVGTALGAYAFGPVPFQWLSQFGLLGAAGLLLLAGRLRAVPGLGVMVPLVAWAAVVTLANLVAFNFPLLMPPLASSPYPVYIALRFVGLLTFAAAAALVYYLLQNGYRDALLRRVVWVGTLTALAAVYIYFAQVQGWWEPGRTRMGTAGGEQATTFAYAFHRAMGTFREPSQLAEWLVLPFFLSFAYQGRGRVLHTLAMSAAMLLTGSLTGVLAIGGGLTGALLLGNPFSRARLRVPLRLAAVAFAGLLLFNAIAVSNGASAADLLEVISGRLGPMLDGGIGQSNRGYVYDYASRQPVPLVGAGVGHANLVFGAADGTPVISAFLSLYVNYWFSLGIPGVVLLALLLLLPVARLVRGPRYRSDPYLMLLLAVYLGWLVMYTVHSEELTLVFGIVFGMVAYEGRPGAARAGAHPA
ncbi:MAG TPA: hypothetical protein VF006_33115 [Longimicrobium sp.]